MGIIRLIVAPIRAVLRSRLFQLVAVLAIVLLLDYYSFDYPPLHQISDGLRRLVDATIQFGSAYVRVGVLTNPVLQVGLIIAYVYIACMLLFYVLRFIGRRLVNFAGAHNVLWLRSTIARERGIAAYRAWVPLERIRPAGVPQQQWEEAYAWPADNRPPYPPLAQRIALGILTYAVVIAVIAVVLQVFTPFPVLTWLAKLTGIPIGQP